MENEIVNVNQPLTVQQVKANVNLIQQVLEGVMKVDVHYGVVPGCGKKPTLLKAGAEKIMATFRLAADPQVEDLSMPDSIRYRLTVRLIAPGGQLVGAGVGECSSDEEKYKWRKAVCEEEFTATPEDRRREKWISPYKEKPYQLKQVRTQPADIANTVLKMAKKRALVDAVLTATAASDIFEQDLEEMPELVQENNGGAKPAVNMPQPKPQPEPSPAPKEPITGDDVGDLFEDPGEPTYLSVSEAMTKSVGETFCAQGILTQAAKRTVNVKGTPKTLTDYTISDPDNKIKITVWDEPLTGLAQNCLLKFRNVQVKEYKGAKQYSALEIEKC